MRICGVVVDVSPRQIFSVVSREIEKMFDLFLSIYYVIEYKYSKVYRSSEKSEELYDNNKSTKQQTKHKTTQNKKKTIKQTKTKQKTYLAARFDCPLGEGRAASRRLESDHHPHIWPHLDEGRARLFPRPTRLRYTKMAGVRLRFASKRI